MSPRIPPPEKPLTTDRPHRTRPASPDPGSSHGTKDDGRQAVLSAPHLAPDVITVSGIVPGLQIRCTGVPVADWLCACGHHERARGRTAVTDLTARVRVGTCPHRAAPAQERRNAA